MGKGSLCEPIGFAELLDFQVQGPPIWQAHPHCCFCCFLSLERIPQHAWPFSENLLLIRLINIPPKNYIVFSGCTFKAPLQLPGKEKTPPLLCGRPCVAWLGRASAPRRKETDPQTDRLLKVYGIRYTSDRKTPALEGATRPMAGWRSDPYYEDGKKEHHGRVQGLFFVISVDDG